VIHYTLTIDTADLSVLTVELRLKNIPDTFRLAFFVHPEYDDRYWRYLEDLQVRGRTGKGTAERLSDPVWRIHTDGGEATIRYRLRLPVSQGQRAAWRPFLSSGGGLIGGPQVFLYVVGATLAPSYVHLQIPKNWQIATGLLPTSDPYSFFAPVIATLVDGPIMVGKFSSWSFAVDKVPHRVVYWSLTSTRPFDTAAFVNAIQKIVAGAAAFFGRLPYRDYSFLIQDNAYGALEHSNSVTLGAPASSLATAMEDYIREIAHEYFHAWNIMRIRPAEYGDVDYKKPPLSKGLWWSEGLTMFYADLLCRWIPADTTSRLQYLEALIREYWAEPGNHKLSAERVSMAAYAPPGLTGDYNGSTHLQGALFGAMLDIVIRSATDGKRSMDDVMRKMMEKFSGDRGFLGADIEHMVSETCGCNVHRFFEDHIRSNKPMDVSKYLRLIGLESLISWKEARDDKDQPCADLQVYAYALPGESPLRVGIMNPSGCWGRAGLHTGDQLLSVNGVPMKTAGDFYGLIRSLGIGDSLRIDIKRNDSGRQIKVSISGYRQPIVRVSEMQGAGEKQRRLLQQWKQAGEW
jgi:predicted metalloprotease with PDZ domain